MSEPEAATNSAFRVYQGNYWLFVSAALWAMTCFIGYEDFISADVGSRITESVGTRIVIFLVLATIAVVFSYWTGKTNLRFTYWLYTRIPFIAFDRDSLTYLGRFTIPWSSVSDIQIVDVPGIRGWCQYLVMVLTPEAQRGCPVMANFEDPNVYRKQVAEKLGLDLASLVILPLRHGLCAVQERADKVLIEAKNRWVADRMLRNSSPTSHRSDPERDSATYLKPLPPSPTIGPLRVIAILASLLFGGGGLIVLFATPRLFFQNLNAWHEFKILGIEIVVAAWLVLAGFLAWLGRREDQGRPDAKRLNEHAIIYPVLSLIVLGPVAALILPDFFSQTLPSMLNEWQGTHFAATYVVTGKGQSRLCSNTIWLSGDPSTARMYVCPTREEFRMAKIGDSVVVEGIGSSYGVRIRSARIVVNEVLR